MGFIQKSAYYHHMAAKHPDIKEVDVDDSKVKNPYTDKVYKCSQCTYTGLTKANAVVHYARIHSEGWIPPYDKEKPECPNCKKEINSVASYLYHCTGCIPASRTHRDNISRIMENA